MQWFVDGKKNFSGPRVNIENLANGEVVGMNPELSREEGYGNGNGVPFGKEGEERK